MAAIEDEYYLDLFVFMNWILLGTTTTFSSSRDSLSMLSDMASIEGKTRGEALFLPEQSSL